MGEQLYHLGFVDDISLVSSNNHQMHQASPISKCEQNQGYESQLYKQPTSYNEGYHRGGYNTAYLCGVVSIDGGSDDDIMVRINLARVAFKMLRRVCSSQVISRRIKSRIF